MRSGSTGIQIPMTAACIDPEISADWAEKEAFYEAKKADQLEQIKEHGKVLDP